MVCVDTLSTNAFINPPLRKFFVINSLGSKELIPLTRFNLYCALHFFCRKYRTRSYKLKYFIQYLHLIYTMVLIKILQFIFHVHFFGTNFDHFIINSKLFQYGICN